MFGLTRIRKDIEDILTICKFAGATLMNHASRMDALSKRIDEQCKEIEGLKVLLEANAIVREK